jgi:hypothetical protein
MGGGVGSMPTRIYSNVTRDSRCGSAALRTTFGNLGMVRYVNRIRSTYS